MKALCDWSHASSQAEKKKWKLKSLANSQNDNYFHSKLQQNYFVNLPKGYKTVIFSQLEISHVIYLIIQEFPFLKLTKCRPPKNMDRSASPLTIFDIIPFHFPLCLSNEPHEPSNRRNWRNLNFSFSENIVMISWYSPWIKSVT